MIMTYILSNFIWGGEIVERIIKYGEQEVEYIRVIYNFLLNYSKNYINEFTYLEQKYLN